MGTHEARAAPPVSIGLPVHDGGRYLREALDSILRQSFADFELVISDNASGDDTQEICTACARSDPRVRYVRQKTNLGATRNWNYVALQARGTFFKWASANDRCAPTMLEECLHALRDDPRLVLCYGRTLLIDDDGGEIGVYDYDPELLDDSPSRRFARLLLELPLNNAQCGLIRAAALRCTRLDRLYPGGDKILMAELALLGKYRRLPSVLLQRRIGRCSATQHLSQQELIAFHDPYASGLGMLAWRHHWDCVSSVLRLPLATGEKLRAASFALRRACWDRRRLATEAVRLVTAGHRRASRA